jgi:hypothetical protein
MKARRKIEIGGFLLILAAIPILYLWCRAKNDELQEGLRARDFRPVACDRALLPEYLAHPNCYASGLSMVGRTRGLLALGAFHAPGRAPTRYMPTTQYLIVVVIPREAAGSVGDTEDRVDVAGGQTALVWSEGHDWPSVARRLDRLQSVQ